VIAFSECGSFRSNLGSECSETHHRPGPLPVVDNASSRETYQDWPLGPPPDARVTGLSRVDRVPVSAVLFSWPSENRIRKYQIDAANIRWTAALFTDIHEPGRASAAIAVSSGPLRARPRVA
jgi:hypothetical protein